VSEIQAPGPADLLAAVVTRSLALETKGVELSDTDRSVGKHLAATFSSWRQGWPAASTRMREVALYESWMRRTAAMLR
jgi:hypothetical protein